ncbi:hypothetical protein P9B03_04930 [Metasolibacillus meyeri]|uniref:NlpC/P60 domain-containing protein n=1 Tax=Metasolibacillus meyeri TaxID=1071052 RepID=A0AAW9NR50_9BACL|nr:hypothetical protein [Metasolibacillus meyeri]MEC1177819.1 hypothetical protein [Metasolibacillus meyeri]
MKIKPTIDIVASWIKSYVPQKDLFFLSADDLERKLDLSSVLVMPKDEFFEHSVYQQPDYVNSYEYWNIKNAQYVIVAESTWIEQLDAEERRFILAAQQKHERGLVAPASFIQNIAQIPSDYIQNEHVILQSHMWEQLDWACKEQLLITMVYEWWDNGECEEAPNALPVFLKPYANKFCAQQGANCLAAVLYGISEGKQPWFIGEWVHQKTFIEKLRQYKYRLTDVDDLRSGDVAIWNDENGVIQHAAYYIGQNLFFNKHGQTIFNPWKLLTKETLYKEWANLKVAVYRQGED